MRTPSYVAVLAWCVWCTGWSTASAVQSDPDDNPVLHYAEKLGLIRRSGSAALQRRVQVLHSCHHEPASAGEGSAFLSFSANCLAAEASLYPNRALRGGFQQPVKGVLHLSPIYLTVKPARNGHLYSLTPNVQHLLHFGHNVAGFILHLDQKRRLILLLQLELVTNLVELRIGQAELRPNLPLPGLRKRMLAALSHTM